MTSVGGPPTAEERGDLMSAPAILVRELGYATVPDEFNAFAPQVGATRRETLRIATRGRHHELPGVAVVRPSRRSWSGSLSCAPGCDWRPGRGP